MLLCSIGPEGVRRRDEAQATYRDGAQGCANVTVDMDVESDCRELRVHGRMRYGHREVGGRVAPGAATESSVRSKNREPRREQWPRSASVTRGKDAESDCAE